MATWISKPWIEQALMNRNEESRPKIARAQILKLEETSRNTIAYISDKKLFVKAVFSQVAVEQFNRDNPSLSMADIQGGLIFVKKYSLQARKENNLDGAEFVLMVDQFKFAGGEGNTQFGSNIIDSSSYPPLQSRLQEMWRLSLLEDHENVFMPEDMEKKLAEIPEWKASYCPPQSVSMQSEISSFNSSTSNDQLQGQVQASCSSMAATGCEQSLATTDKRGSSQYVSLKVKCDSLPQSATGKKQKDNSQFSMGDDSNDKRTPSQKMTSAKSGEGMSESHQLINSRWSEKSEDILPSIHTPEKQQQEGEMLARDRKNTACMERSRESRLNQSATSCSRSAMYSDTVENLMIGSPHRTVETEGQQRDLEYLEKQDSNKQQYKQVCTANKSKKDIKIGNGLMVAANIDQPSKYTADCVADTPNQFEVLDSLGQSQILAHEIKGKENNDYNSKFASPQEESTVALVSSDYVSSSQVSVVLTQPLRGLHVASEEQCSPSSETSQLKGNSGESYSILQGRSAVAEKSPEVNVVPSSENSEEFELEEPLANVTPGRITKQIHCSLSESQLGNLLDSSISIDDVTTPPCLEDAPVASQEGYTRIIPRTAQQEGPTSCGHEMGEATSSSDSLHLANIVVDQPCVKSSKDLTGKRSIHESGSKGLEKSSKALLKDHKEAAVNHKTVVTTDFDALFSQNTWSFSQTSDKELIADLVEIDRRQSVKRKRSEVDSHVNFTCPSDDTRQGNKAQVRDSPVSPDSTSNSLKSSSHSGSSQSQPANHSPSIYLNKPIDLYSQQDPLVLDTSTESAGSTDGVIDNDSGLLITGSRVDDVQSDTSPSILGRSTEERCTLTTPTFDSLPSFQVPADNITTPLHVTPPSRDQKCKLLSSATRRQEAETRQDPGPNKKKRKPRRRNFNWFSDAY